MTEPILLHPMGLLEIALHSFRIYVRNLPTLLLLAALLFGPPLVLSVLGVMLLGREFSIAVILLILAVIGFFAGLFYFYAAATLAVSLHLIGLNAGLVQILRRLRGPVAIQLLGTGILQSLAILGGLLLLIIPGVIFLIRFIFASPVVVLEHVAYAGAMRRSRDLVSGHWWRLFRAFLLVSLVAGIGSSIIGLIVSILLTVIFMVIGVGGFGLGFQEALVIGQYLVLPVTYIYPVLLYYDIRIRKEALNIETIREAI